MSTIPTPTYTVSDLRVYYSWAQGDVLQEFRLNNETVNALTDTELTSVLSAMDTAVLAHVESGGQVQRHLEYNYTSTVVTDTVIRAS